MRPPSTRRPVARANWISLFAMLMMFIGPLVSQSMPMEHRMGSVPMDGMPAMEHGSHGEHSDHHGKSAADSELHALLEKCGYCSLFFHCPALPQALGTVGVERQAAVDFIVAVPRHGHGRQAVFPGARTRAPPLFA